MKLAEVENTYAEAFDGLFCRILITARDKTRLEKAAFGSTALPMVVIGRTEGGVERLLKPAETPDGRVGVIVQFWGGIDESKPIEASLKKFIREVSYRIRQEILVEPTTCVLDASDSQTKFDVMDTVGHCGDGFEWEEVYAERRVINVPIMMPTFRIERYLGYGVGVSGGNLWLMCQNEDLALKAGDKALEAVHVIEGVITPFDVCAAGSKPETKYPEIGPTTNHLYAPSLREKISDSKVPEGVNSIPEIVINGVSLYAVKEAMKAAIDAVKDIQGVVKISAGNYDGKLGKYKIYLHELL
ncbi:MAG TPA: formylmethanofuran--tetrahydromethanopterin N-formyltransferase [Candidatus Bathyarchaeia archaeon]|nr:formylmethanofuran--tetrahydromethanopterin N-formyltransferase [Candidatus Bathyarchaeia archaeon]